jgi:pimeloyl-ACP methyl ester carboxylesterase
MPGKPALSINPGSKGLPWVLFVHGLGIGSEIWEAPEKTRILGGLYPLTSLLRGKKELKTLYQDLWERGYTTATWNQERPVGELAYPLKELEDVLSVIRAKRPSGIILLGHSRGGIVARKYLEHNRNGDIRAYISIASPHRGSTMAKWQKYIKPITACIKPFLKENSKSTYTKAMRRMIGFIESPAVRELLPDSPLLAPLVRPAGDFPSFSVGGTKPLAFQVMGLKFPYSMGEIFPGGANILPEEMREGLGDGLVSARSALYPFSSWHADFPLNHVELLFDKAARNSILEKIPAN